MRARIVRRAGDGLAHNIEWNEGPLMNGPQDHQFKDLQSRHTGGSGLVAEVGAGAGNLRSSFFGADPDAIDRRASISAMRKM
jgi:hypothetical protein